MYIVRRDNLKKVQDNIQTSWKYNLVSSLPPKDKILSILGKDYLKWKLNFFRSALLHMKTTVFLKYFVRACSTRLKYIMKVTGLLSLLWLKFKIDYNKDYLNRSSVSKRPHLFTLWFNNVMYTKFFFFFSNLKEKEKWKIKKWKNVFMWNQNYYFNFPIYICWHCFL